MFWKKWRQKQWYEEQAFKAIEKLKEKDRSYLSRVYSVFASGHKILIKEGGMAISSLVKSYSMADMIRLNQLFRQYTSMEWHIDWQSVDLKRIKDQFATETDYIYALMLGTFHPNGYFRERCMCDIAEFEGTLPYFILRMNDWVKPIRLQACALVKKKLEDCPVAEIFQAAQALETVKWSGRRENEYLQAVETIIRERIEQDLKIISIDDIFCYEFRVRVSIYRILFSKQMLSIEAAEQLLEKEKHSFCQVIIIEGILKHYDCSISRIDKYLNVKDAAVRKKALEYKFAVIKNTWPGLEEMLLDKSYGIRQFVSFILRQYSQCSIPEFYIDHLHMEKPIIPILGLGESGDKNMAEYLKPFLKDQDDRIVRSALIAIGKLLGMEGDELYWSHLFSGSHTVAKACYKTIWGNGIHYGAKRIYQAYCNSTVWYEKKYLLLVLLKAKTWERLPYLVYLYGEGNTEMMTERILEGMWERSLYARITKKQSDKIEKALNTYVNILPEKLIAEIRFDLRFLNVQES